jgi:hypothetical protein
MSRLRALTGIVVLAAAGVLVPATAALAAYTPLTPVITCDGATGAVTTSVSGNLLASGTTPTPVTVEFQRLRGVRVTATASSPLPTMAQPFTVKTTANPAGDIAATGYTGTFDPVTSFYYRETMRVTFKNTSTGAPYGYREATCQYDQRTTAALTCDPVAGTVTATATGVNGQAGSAEGSGRAAKVGYRVTQITQATKDGPIYRAETPWGYDVQHGLTRAADGSWADAGYVRTIKTHPYRYSEELTVEVLDPFNNVVGTASAKCTLYDGSQS